MAKSKVGGTRAYIRGRIGSDVYSIGKNGKGVRQQVVRSLAEQVSNPRSSSQMFGRMVMSTVMQAVSALKPIIDHSFDGLPVGQPSISEFIRVNYGLVKADAVAHPASANTFGLNKYQEKGVKTGFYMVSSGSAVVPTAVTTPGQGIDISLTADTLTVGGLKTALGLNAEGYLTFLFIDSDSNCKYFRAHLNTSLADATAITAENVDSLFETEGNDTVTISLSSNTIEIYGTNSDADSVYGVIVSDKQDGQWIHSRCILKGASGTSWNADTALPTYPTGAAQFLNGGDL